MRHQRYSSRSARKLAHYQIIIASNSCPFDFIESYFIESPVVKLGGAGAGVIRLEAAFRECRHSLSKP
jgi:hypothetical protein